jgi:hypothetical protein
MFLCPLPAAPQIPARSATLADQGATEREIADLQQQSAALDALFEQRKQQFAGVLAALEALQRCIDREEPEEGGGAAGDGGAVAGAAPHQQGGAAQQQPMQVG